MASSILQDIERSLSLPNPRYPRWVIRSESRNYLPLLVEGVIVHALFPFLADDDALSFGRTCKAMEAARKKATKTLVFSSDDDALQFAKRSQLLYAAKKAGKNIVIFHPRGSHLTQKVLATFSSRFANFSRFKTLQFFQRNFDSDAVAANIASLLRDGESQNIQAIRFSVKAITQSALAPLLSACPKLRSVEFPEDVTMLTTSNRALLESLKKCPDFRFFDVARFYPAALLSPRDLETHLKCWPSLEAISIPATYNHEHMAVIANCCPNLRAIHFDGCTHINPAAMMNLADHCPLLERIDIKGSDHFFTPEVLGWIKQKCKKFQSLHLLDCKTNDAQLAAIKELGALTTLRICSSQANFTDTALREMFAGLTCLTHLALQVCAHNCKITCSTIYSLPASCKNLRYLSLERCGPYCTTPYFSPASILKSVSALPHLEFLSLQFNHLLQEQNLRSMRPLTKLKFLDLSCPGFFSADHLRAFISSLPNLSYLRLPKMQVGALLETRRLQDVFPSVHRCYTTDEISHFPDSLLRNYQLPTRQIYTLTLEAGGKSPSPQKEERKEQEAPLE